MNRQLTLYLSPYQAAHQTEIIKAVAKHLQVPEKTVHHVELHRRSIDARKSFIKIQLLVTAYLNKEHPTEKRFAPPWQQVAGDRHVAIIGAGPAGLFAALKLIEHGIKPIIIERGKEISERKKDIATINREHIINPESNYCFGEGGAGTFSDGKLYTRSKKRGDTQRALNILHYHGADQDILIDAQPHIGTDKLPIVIKNIRKTIIDSGGEFLFNTKLTDLIIHGDKISGLKTSSGETIPANDVILATGHSARDVYGLLKNKGLKLMPKAFAAGVRVEHPQELIDSIQYHTNKLRSKYLPAATYRLNAQIDNRGVYSFCMCPGGFIVPSATSPDQTVVNGMSPAARNSPYANSGIVVEIQLADLNEYSQHEEMMGIEFQNYIETMAYNNGGRGQKAPGQRLTDFVNGTISQSLPHSSYIPGLVSSPIHHWLPEMLSVRLREGFRQFDKKMKGFITEEAIIAGVESRTSSPVFIPRNKETFEHIQINGLYPCGEGAGYAGGILSSAIDGENCALSILKKNGLLNKS